MARPTPLLDVLRRAQQIVAAKKAAPKPVSTGRAAPHPGRVNGEFTGTKVDTHVAETPKTTSKPGWRPLQNILKYGGGTPGTGLQMAGGVISALPGNIPKLFGNILTGWGLQKAQNYADRFDNTIYGGSGNILAGSETGEDMVETAGNITEGVRDELGLEEGEGIIGATYGDTAAANEAYASGIGAAYGTAADQIRASTPEYEQSSQMYWNSALGAYKGTADDLTDATGGYARDVMQQYQDRYSRNMGYIDKLGQTERDYVNRQYDKMNALTSQRLADLGLGGTTVGASMIAGNERRRTQDMNAVEENLMGMKFNADVGLSGDVAGAVERMGGMTTNLANEITLNRFNMGMQRRGELRGIADWQTGALADLETQRAFNMPQLRYGLDTGLIGTRMDLAGQGINMLTGADVAPPDFSPYYQGAQQLGYAGVPAYGGTRFGGMGGLGGAGIGAGVGMLVGGFTPIGGLAGGAIGGAVGYGGGTMLDR